jgi:hypothetical protein
MILLRERRRPMAPSPKLDKKREVLNKEENEKKKIKLDETTIENKIIETKNIILEPIKEEE